MKIQTKPTFNRPIPGENYTADTRNYPWHRPPQYTGYDEAVDALISRLNSDKEGELIYSLIELEVPVYIIVSNYLMRHIMRGFIPIDLAILMAGPMARMIEMIGKNNGQSPDMTTEDPRRQVITPTLLKLQAGDVESLRDLPKTDAANQDEEPGLMAAAPEDIVEVAPDDVQAQMLGMTNDEEEML